MEQELKRQKLDDLYVLQLNGNLYINKMACLDKAIGRRNSKYTQLNCCILTPRRTEEASRIPLCPTSCQMRQFGGPTAPLTSLNGRHRQNPTAEPFFGIRREITAVEPSRSEQHLSQQMALNAKHRLMRNGPISYSAKLPVQLPRSPGENCTAFPLQARVAKQSNVWVQNALTTAPCAKEGQLWIVLAMTSTTHAALTAVRRTEALNISNFHPNWTSCDLALEDCTM